MARLRQWQCRGNPRCLRDSRTLQLKGSAVHIVAYDIADARERNRVAKALADFGERVQKSVWISMRRSVLRKGTA